MNFDFSAATLKKAVRVFVYAFLAVYGVPQILAAASGSAPIDTTLLRAAAVSGLAALIGYFWNAVMDPSPVPSLKP